MTNAVVLFLDFDGVTHSAPVASTRRYGEPRADYRPLIHLPRLEALLREPAHRHVQVCISSSWKDAYPWDVIISFFSEDIQPRVIGKTPNQEPSKSNPYWRGAEIAAWLEANPQVKGWVALDDAGEAFPPGMTASQHLVVCDPVEGLRDDATFERLRRALEFQSTRL